MPKNSSSHSKVAGLKGRKVLVLAITKNYNYFPAVLLHEGMKMCCFFYDNICIFAA